jgi:Tol biopolymer transport system component
MLPLERHGKGPERLVRPTCVARAIAFSGFLLILANAAFGQATLRASVSSADVEGNRDSGTNSFAAAVSGDGQVIAFESLANNLVAGDSNKTWDVFVRDRATGITELGSVDSLGVQGNDQSFYPSLSSDGRYVAFCSDASNLVPGDTNGATDVFVRDRVAGSTIRVSVDSFGFEATGSSFGLISADGLWVTFSSDAQDLVAFDFNSSRDVFIHDMASGVTERLSVDSAGIEGNGDSALPAISADGSIVAYFSNASNLVAGDLNGTYDIFVRDCGAGTTERVSVDSIGVEGNGMSLFPAISSDGLLVAFESDATNLVTPDTNSSRDIFIHDRATGQSRRLSVDSLGNEADDGSFSAQLSGDGSVVSFYSAATNLVPSDSNGWADVFVHNLSSNGTERVSIDSGGVEGNGASYSSSISADGQVVVYAGWASNLVGDDTNLRSDVFVRDLRLQAAGWSNYGTGLAGSFGVPQLTARSNPVIGTQLTIDIGNSAAIDSIGLVVLGFQAAQLHTNRGSDILVLPFLVSLISVPSAGQVLTGLLPADQALSGLHVYLQAVEADSGAIKGVSFTSGLDLTLGY